MKRKMFFARYGFIAHCGVILATCVAIVLGGSMTAQSQTMTPDRDDVNITKTQAASLDSFLDTHPQLGRQLRENPSLVNNQEFVEDHPDLQQFLQEHPGIQQDLSQNPNRVMRQEQRFDRSEERNRGQELANFDQFMDSHPEIAEQLRRDPSLIDNGKFVQSHPALQQFLADHPGVNDEYKENPNAFMNQEQRYDRREDQDRDRNVNRQELANMDRFMDSHPEIAEQLHKDPSLVNDKKFVTSHPALQQFLADHPGVREEYQQNPTAFMNQEQRYDRREDFNGRRGRDVTRGELASFNEFMEDHSAIAGELSKNPSLAKNGEYLENHPELRDYLKSNPKVNEELSENPQAFMQSAQQFNGHTAARVGEAKSK